MLKFENAAQKAFKSFCSDVFSHTAEAEKLTNAFKGEQVTFNIMVFKTMGMGALYSQGKVSG